MKFGARCHRCADHDKAVIAKLRHLAFEHGYSTVAVVQLLRTDKSQNRLAARRASRTAPETAVMATILIRLCLASDSGEDTCAIRFALAFLRFDFCDVRIAFLRRCCCPLKIGHVLAV